MANYVKFRRGTPEGFKALGRNIEQDTLYFIYDEAKSTADLYLGSRLISSGENDLGALSALQLGDLTDVSLESPLSSSDVLVYNEQTKHWENRALEDLLETYNPTASILVDDVSIESIEGKLQLKDFGTGYFAYVPAEKDDSGDIITPSSYQYVEGFKENLELRVIATEDNVLSLAWYESNSEDIDNLTNEVLRVSKNVEDLSSLISADNGLTSQVNTIKNDIQNLQSTKVDSSQVYTKSEIDDIIQSTTEDVYKKSEVYTKEETKAAIDEAVAGADHLKRVIVQDVSDIDVNDAQADTYIYMVPVGFSAEDNKYDEYIVINGDLEKVGSWEVDLNGYATTDYVNQELEKKVDYVEGSRLITAEESAKLEALQLNGEDLQISGNINTSQIIDLKQWLGLNAQSTPGLSENNYTTEDKQKLQDLLYIKSVDETQLHVSNAGTLSILSVDVNKITGLDDILNSKATKASVSNLTTQLNAYTEEVNDRLDGIENRLKWHPLTDA